MRRIVAIASAALMAVPLSIGAAVVAEATPHHATGGSPEIGGDEGPVGMAGIGQDPGDSKKQKKERRERGSSVAGIGPGDNPVEEGQGSVPDTNGLSTEDSPLGDDGPLDGPAR